MNGPRSKNVTVGGREFVVRPALGIVQRELETTPPPTDTVGVCDWCAKVLKRGAPDITPQWLMENGDTAEYGDVIAAFVEVTTGKKATQPGEAPAP